MTKLKELDRHDTPPSQDASTHQIWDAYVKGCSRYAPDAINLKNEVRGQGHSNSKMLRDTPSILRCIHTSNLGFLPQRI